MATITFKNRIYREVTGRDKICDGACVLISDNTKSFIPGSVSSSDRADPNNRFLVDTEMVAIYVSSVWTNDETIPLIGDRVQFIDGHNGNLMCYDYDAMKYMVGYGNGSVVLMNNVTRIMPRDSKQEKIETKDFDGKTYKVFTSDTPVFFDPAADSIMWDGPGSVVRGVCFSYDPRVSTYKVKTPSSQWKKMALLSDEIKPLLMTHEQLSQFTSTFGEIKFSERTHRKYCKSKSRYIWKYNFVNKDEQVNEYILCRWNLGEWKTPTLDLYNNCFGVI